MEYTCGTHCYSSWMRQQYSQKIKIWLMITPTARLCRTENMVRSTSQLFAAGGQKQASPRDWEFLYCQSKSFSAFTEDIGDSYSETQDRRTKKISSPIQHSKSYIYAGVRSVCVGSWNEKTKNHYAALPSGKVWNPCRSPPPTNMGCLLGITGKVVIPSLKGSHAVRARCRKRNLSPHITRTTCKKPISLGPADRWRRCQRCAHFAQLEPAQGRPPGCGSRAASSSSQAEATLAWVVPCSALLQGPSSRLQLPAPALAPTLSPCAQPKPPSPLERVLRLISLITSEK